MYYVLVVRCTVLNVCSGAGENARHGVSPLCLPVRVRRNNTFVLLNEELSVNELRSRPVGGERGKNCLVVCVNANIPGVFTFPPSNGSYQFFGRTWLSRGLQYARSNVANRNEVESGIGVNGAEEWGKIT